MAIDLAQYKLLYLQTAWDYIRNLESSLSILLNDPKNAEAVESAHIAAHSLKSQSLVMKYEKFGMVCRDLEYLFRDVKEGKRQLTAQELGILQEVIDSLKESLAQISAENTEKDLSAAEQQLIGLMSGNGGDI